MADPPGPALEIGFGKGCTYSFPCEALADRDLDLSGAERPPL
ncbi:MAG: hypothetical protein P8Z76_07865 [Alphaproteobacteria bacterium]